MMAVILVKIAALRGLEHAASGAKSLAGEKECRP